MENEELIEALMASRDEEFLMGLSDLETDLIDETETMDEEINQDEAA